MIDTVCHIGDHLGLGDDLCLQRSNYCLIALGLSLELLLSLHVELAILIGLLDPPIQVTSIDQMMHR